MFFRMVYKSGQIFLSFCHNSRVWRTDGQTDGRTEFSSQYRVCSAIKRQLLLLSNPLFCVFALVRSVQAVLRVSCC